MHDCGVEATMFDWGRERGAGYLTWFCCEVGRIRCKLYFHNHGCDERKVEWLEWVIFHVMLETRLVCSNYYKDTNGE